MKMTTEHYETVKKAFSSLDTGSIETHKAKVIAEGSYKDFNTRIVYDLARASIPVSWVCDTLYKYLNDDHIKTAYIKAAKELNLISVGA